MWMLRLKAVAVTAACMAAFCWAGPAGAAEVELEDPGEEPRRELRYTPEVGATQRYEGTDDITLTSEIEGVPPREMVRPQVLYDFETTVERVEDGVIELSGKYVRADARGGPGVDPAEVAEVQARADRLRGMEFTIEANDRGVVQSVNFHVENPDAEMQQLLEGFDQELADLITPLPEEPVGVGAKWSAHATITVQGVTFDQTMTYELQSLDQEEFTVMTLLEFDAEAQEVDVSELGPGVTLELQEGGATGEGEMVGRFESLVADSTIMVGEIRAVFAVEGQGRRHIMNQQIETVTRTNLAR